MVNQMYPFLNSHGILLTFFLMWRVTLYIVSDIGSINFSQLGCGKKRKKKVRKVSQRRLGNLFSSWVIGRKAFQADWTSTLFCAVKPHLLSEVQRVWAHGFTCPPCMTEIHLGLCLLFRRWLTRVPAVFSDHVFWFGWSGDLPPLRSSQMYKQNFRTRQKHLSPSSHQQAAWVVMRAIFDLGWVFCFVYLFDIFLHLCR